MRPIAAAFLLAMGALAPLSACGSTSPTLVNWHLLSPDQLPSGPGSQAFPDAVVEGGDGQPWLIGGVIVTPVTPTKEGLVVTNERTQVAIWEAATPSGRWTLANMIAIPGRDGPFETILRLARRGTTAVAFGSRASPTEGYPRPSTWTRTPAGWQETLEPRELFGGPDIIGFGGMTVGPHGFFIAGTWSDSHGHGEASVWSSPSGSAWERESDPSFEGVRGETPIGEGVADNVNGLLLIATIEAPTPENPVAEQGGAWYSQDGKSWTRLNPSLFAQSTFGAVVAQANGWVIAGTVASGGNQRPAVWTVSTRLSVSKPQLLPGRYNPDSRITGAWSSGTRLFVAGVTNARPVLWSAAIDSAGVPSGWTRLQGPPGRLPDLQRVAGSAGNAATVIVLVGKTSSEVWRS